MLNDIFRSIGPIIAAAMAGKFENGEFRFDGFNMKEGRFHFDTDWDGVPVDELDPTQPGPEKVVVFGPTHVRITEGKTFRVQTDGEGADTIRFAMRDSKLVVMRRDPGTGTTKKSTVDITMPAPRSLVLTGSGSIESNAVAANAKVVVAGSGSIALSNVAGERLKANLMGSGRLQAIGSVDRLKLVSAGSGHCDMADLEVGNARLAVTGSGSVRLSSDGEIDAKMMGSGHVTVYGRANCRVHSMGSGRLNCVPRDRRDDEPDAPASPEPPKPPKSGGAAAKPKKPRKAAKPKAAKTAKVAKAAKTAKKAAGKRNPAARKKAN